jgi:Flp pilus assembly protein TadD
MKFHRRTAALAVVTSMAIAAPALAGPAEDGNAGLDALNQGDFARAVALFTRALSSGKLSHDDMEFAYAKRGEAYLKQGAATAATSDFKHALKLKPDDQDVQAGLSEAQSQSAADSPHGRSGKSSAGHAQQDAESGMNALNAGEYGQAIQMFSRAINSGALNNDDKELALLSRGKAYNQKGDYSLAVMDLNRALHLKPDDQEALGAFGVALSHMQSRTPVTGMDGPTCTKNFSAIGSVFTGKSYTGFVEYQSLPTLDAFAGVYRGLSVYTPVPGTPWQVTGANLDAGSITASITFADSGRAITLEARIEPDSGGSRITIKETVPGLLPTIDLKGSLCNILTGAAMG